MSVFDIQKEMDDDFPPLPSSGSDTGGTTVFKGLSATANPLMLTRPPTPPVTDVTITETSNSNNATTQANEISNLLAQVPEHDLLALLREHKLQKSSYSSIAQQPAPVAPMPVASMSSSRPKNHEHMYYSSNTESASVSSLQRNIDRQHQRNVNQRNLHLQQDIAGKGLSLQPPHSNPTQSNHDSKSGESVEDHSHLDVNSRDQSNSVASSTKKSGYHQAGGGGGGDDGYYPGANVHKKSLEPGGADPLYVRQAKQLEFAKYDMKASHQAWLNGMMRKCHDHPEIRHCIFAQKNSKGVRISP